MAAITFKGRHFQHDMILQSVRWYLAYSLSYRDIEEMMAERGFTVDHSTINRWVLHYSPQLDAAFRQKKKRVGHRWRMDETYVKIKGQWKYYYRAVDKQGQTIDFLLTATRDTQAALRFLKKAIAQNGTSPFSNFSMRVGSTSMHVTVRPNSAKQAPVTNPTYPVPSTLIGMATS